MRAGSLDRRVTIERFVVGAADEFNAPIEQWAEVATVWAHAAPSRGSERHEAAEIVGGDVMTFRIRHRSDVTVTDRIRYNGKIWNIVSVREIGRRVGTEIDAMARSDG